MTLGKVFVEGTEIIMTEKERVDDGEHIIKDGEYILKSTAKRDFKSSIYEYAAGEKVLVSKVIRFSKEYYKIVLFSDQKAKAWNLLELPADMDIRMRRLSGTMFFIWTINQISFCEILPSTRVQEFTTNFVKLNDIFFESEYVMVSYNDEGRNTVASFGHDGRLIKTHFEG
ncbi:MAG: hypothetical protein FWE31_03555 [Firmicutes bacterium]|nr:hypothetical protein [Bacillota bacterium]